MCLHTAREVVSHQGINFVDTDHEVKKAVSALDNPRTATDLTSRKILRHIKRVFETMMKLGCVISQLVCSSEYEEDENKTCNKTVNNSERE